jgi:hypothetical protein
MYTRRHGRSNKLYQFIVVLKLLQREEARRNCLGVDSVIGKDVRMMNAKPSAVFGNDVLQIKT